MPLNVNGPINSIPARWATNAKPQMADVIHNMMMALRLYTPFCIAIVYADKIRGLCC